MHNIDERRRRIKEADEILEKVFKQKTFVIDVSFVCEVFLALLLIYLIIYKNT